MTRKQYIGIALVVAGALLLLLASLMGWTSSNWVLLAGLGLVVSGVLLHVRYQKKSEKY